MSYVTGKIKWEIERFSNFQNPLKGKAWKMGINKDKIINEGIQVWNVKSLQPGKESIEMITEKTKNDRETKNKRSKTDRYQKSAKSSETRY